MTSYPEWFDETHRFAPHAWQGRLGEASCCENRLIRVPTGMGKTIGVLSSWIYHRLVRRDQSWPRRYRRRLVETIV